MLCLDNGPHEAHRLVVVCGAQAHRIQDLLAQRVCLVLGHVLEAEGIRPCAALDLVQRSDDGVGRHLLVLWNLGVGEVVGEDVLEVTPVVDGVGV